MRLRTVPTAAPTPLRLVSVAALCLALLGFAFPAAAVADSRIGSTQLGPTVSLPGDLAQPAGVAVSTREGNDIYVADTGPNQRVAQFEPDGTFVRAFGWGVVPGAAAATGDLSAGSTLVGSAATTSGRLLPGGVLTGPGIPPGDEITEVSPAELKLSEPAEATETGAALGVVAGPGNAPVNERQQLAIGGAPTGGSFTLSFASPAPGSTTTTTTALPFNATSAAVQAALEGLPNIGTGNIEASGPAGGPYQIEFKGSRYTDTNVDQISADPSGLTPSGTATIATTAQGAAALETCTIVCSFGEEGSGPGQLDWSDEIAVDNDPSSSSYGDLYVVDQRNFRIEKFSPEGELLLIFGGEVDKGPHHPGNLCTAAYISEGDTCGAGVPGSAHGSFEQVSHQQSWAEEGMNSITVGPDGTVYVGDYRRIQEFEPDGSYKSELSMPEATAKSAYVGSLAIDSEAHIYADAPMVDERQRVNPPASGSYTLTFEGEQTEAIPFNAEHATVASALGKLSSVGGAGNLQVEVFGGIDQITFINALADRNMPQMTASNATVETLVEGAAGELVELGPSAELLHVYPLRQGADDIHLATDAEGSLFLSERVGEGVTFRAYRPGGALFAEIESDQVVPREGRAGTALAKSAQVFGLAVSPNGSVLYGSTSKIPGDENTEPTFNYIAAITGPAEGPPLVSKLKATDVEPETATLHAVVNPSELDTHYRFQWITEKQCKENETAGHECFLGAEEQPPAPGADLGSLYHPYPVQAAISGLSLNTAYRYRLLTANSAGAAELEAGFATLPAVSVRNFSTRSVAPEVVVLQAEINPNNGTGAEYTICYGPEEGSYSAGCVSGVLPTGSEFKPVSATFNGLAPDTEYHYILKAHDSYGLLETTDQTFLTEETSAEQDAREGCSNAILREESDSTALPDCRAYEQVSERDKHGGQASSHVELSPSGEHVGYVSGGDFAGAQVNSLVTEYLAHRTQAGWVTQPVIGRPAAGYEAYPYFFDAGYYSAELDKWLFLELDAPNAVFARNYGVKDGFFSVGFLDGSYVAQATPHFELVEGPPRAFGGFETIQGQSEDLSRIYIATRFRLLPSPADERPNDEQAIGGHTRVYEVSGVGGPDPAFRLAAEVPLGILPSGGGNNCLLDFGGGDASASMNRNFARFSSADGATLFYTLPIEGAPQAQCGQGTQNPIGLFARTAPEPGGPATVTQLNSPPPSQCHSGHPCFNSQTADPHYGNASPGGRLVWFSTSQPLIDSDTDNTEDLYLAKLSESGALEELVQASAGQASASHPDPGKGAAVQGLVRTSADGTHAAFVAAGVLTEEENSSHQSAAQGADNLYVYDAASGETKFVARLCSGPEESGSLAESACPSGGEIKDNALWEGTAPARAHFTPAGRFLVFQSYGRLAAGDTDAASDVYRYDFASGQLVRISLGHRGNDANGNDDRYQAELGIEVGGSSAGPTPAELAEDTGRQISADGSTVVFDTSAPLVSRDTNGAPDVYEWEEDGHGSCREAGGCVSLLSDGVDQTGTQRAVISSSGRDIVFQAQRNEVPTDTDGVGDIYDARIDGGFPYTPPAIPCGGNEPCHHAVPPPPPAPKISTENEIPNPPVHIHCPKGKHREKRHGQIRCVPNKLHKAKKHHKRASTSRGGSK